MAEIIDSIVPLALFTLIVLVVYFPAKFNYQIKKSIIEKGGNIQLPQKTFPFLEIGLTLLGIGMGLGFAVIPQQSGLDGDAKDLMTAACILLFGGIGLISSFFIRRKLDAKKQG